MSTSAQSRRSRAGLLSSARSFFLPIGSHIDPARVHGYPIDMRVKARQSTWPPFDPLTPDRMAVEITQYGLGCYEHWISGEGEAWLESAVGAARHLLDAQEPDGSWLHRAALRHTYELPCPWRSAMAQGEAASLLVRLQLTTGEDAFAAGALKALRPLDEAAPGGLRAELGGGPWFEEYPTRPSSYVLNGGIFALWGIRDVAVGLNDDRAARTFQDGLATLVANLHRFDTGWWSLYSLFPHPVRNLASSFYHALHIQQLGAMNLLEPRSELVATRDRWAQYANSTMSKSRAFTGKVGFRLLVPRNRLIAQPAARFWTRSSGGANRPPETIGSAGR